MSCGLRILLTTDVVGGVWSYTEELADALAARGHVVALVAFGGEPNASQRAWLELRPQIEFAAVACPLEWMPEPEPGLSSSVEAVRAVVAQFVPDVVHLNQFYYGAFELGAPKIVVAHSDVVSWWRIVKEEEPPDDPWFRRYRAWVREGLSGAGLRVAPTAWFASQVAAIYDGLPVRTVYNGRSATRWGRASPRDVARPTHGRPPEGHVAHGRATRAHGTGGHPPDGPPPDDAATARPRPPRVVGAGRLWDRAKGARDLIDAAARLGVGVDVVVAGPVQHPAGDDDFPTDVPEIRWAGDLASTELHALLAETRVYAATSRYEPFGLAPLEAVLAGCALVASDIPTFRELWDGCALFYPPGDADALARALGALCEDDARCQRLARAARTRALQRYTPERMAAGYEALYRELLARHSRTRPVGTPDRQPASVIGELGSGSPATAATSPRAGSAP